MEKLLNKVSSILLLLAIAGSYVMWVVGIDTKATAYMYSHSPYFLFIIVGIVLVLNIKRLLKEDWVIIGVAVLVFVCYMITTTMRGSNHIINAGIPTILLLVLCFKTCQFDTMDRMVLFLISGSALSTLFYRLYIELPKIVPVDMIGRTGNKIESIWINTNTIGAAILFAALMISVFIKAAPIGYFKLLIIPVYAVGLIGVWATESKTSLIVFVLFILLDTVLPKRFLQEHKSWLLIILLLMIAAPFVCYYFAQSDKVDLFTGRERIWKEFFAKWLSNKQHIWIGMAPFRASWKPLGTHNGFLYVLANYGVVGYAVFVGYFSYLIGKIITMKKTLSKIQVELFLAFFIVLAHSFMEDIILAYYWMPIVYSFIGFALQNQKASPTRKYKHQKSV